MTKERSVSEMPYEAKGVCVVGPNGYDRCLDDDGLAIDRAAELNTAYHAGKAAGEAEMAKLLVTIDNVLETDTCNGCKTVEGLVSPALSRSGGMG